MFDCILLIIMLFLNICMVTACQAHLHLDDFVDPRWRVQHVCTVLLYVCCDVLMFVALKYKWVSKGKHVNLDPEWSLNDKADVSPGTYFFCVCVCLEVIELHGKIEWLNRGEISQSLKHSYQLAPGNIGNRLCQYKAAVFFAGFRQGGRGDSG